MIASESRTEHSLRAEVLEVGNRLASWQYRLAKLVVELDESGEWAFDGAPTCAHWIAMALVHIVLFEFKPTIEREVILDVSVIQRQ